MGKRVPVRLLLGGAYSAGDAGSIPDGSVRELVNFLPRPNRMSPRPPFAYDGLADVRSLATWDDKANHKRRLLAIDVNRLFYVKNTTGETWSAANATVLEDRVLTDAASYRGTTYIMLAANATDADQPDRVSSFDGTVLAVHPFDARDIYGRCATVFNDRILLAYTVLGVYANDSALVQANVAELAYDWSIAPTLGAFSYTNVTATINTTGTVKTCRLTPTSTASQACSVYPYATAIAPLQRGLTTVLTTDNRYVQWLFSSRGVDAVTNVPFTIEWILFSEIDRNQALALDAVMTTGESRYRVKVAGTTAAVAPAYGTTAGGDTVDGTATLTCIGSAILATSEGTVPNISVQPNVIGRYLTAYVPQCPNTVTVIPRLKFYNTTHQALTVLVPIDISYRDGLADGDPQKANWGQQFTRSEFRYPFYNCETNANANIQQSQILWSELGQPKRFLATNTYQLSEGTGFPTAACAAAARYIVFKRQTYWVFQATTDPDIPIRREGTVHDGVGCIGPRALDTWEDVVFFIGESDIYMMEPGDTPQPICGDGMREEIMDQGAGWVEDNGVYNKMALLAIDKRKLILWAYTQKNKLYAYDLRAKLWSKHQVGDGFEVAAMLWNQNAGHMYVAFGGHGLARMDYETGATTGANDAIDNTGTTYAGTMSITFKAIEHEDNDMPVEFKLEHITPRVSCKIAGQQITGSYSFDKGETFPKSQTLSITSLTTGKDFKPVRLDCQQSDLSITPKITVTGKLGEVAGTLSPKIFGMIDPLKPYVTHENQTPGAANL